MGQNNSRPICLCGVCTCKRWRPCCQRKIPRRRLEGIVEFGGQHSGRELWRWQGDTLERKLEGFMGVR